MYKDVGNVERCGRVVEKRKRVKEGGRERGI